MGETQLVALGFGLPAPGPDEPFFTAAEAAALKRFGELREIWPPEVYLQIVRVYGQALAHIAQTEVHLFRLHVEPQLHAAPSGTLGGLAPSTKRSASSCRWRTRCCSGCTGAVSSTS